MSQTLSLFDWQQPVVSPTPREQARELVRVERGIGLHVLQFCREHPTVSVEDLRRYVVERTGRAPSSPDRILRQLRSKGLVCYVATKGGRYSVTSVRA